MVRHTRSWLLPLLELEADCPSVSPDLLLAMRRRASSRLCADCGTFQPLSVTGSVALLVALLPSFSVQTSFTVNQFSQKLCEP